MFTMFLFLLINKPTCITNQCHSTIDNIYTNSIGEDSINGVAMADINDQFTFLCILQQDTHTHTHK